MKIKRNKQRAGIRLSAADSDKLRALAAKYNLPVDVFTSLMVATLYQKEFNEGSDNAG